MQASSALRLLCYQTFTIVLVIMRQITFPVSRSKEQQTVFKGLLVKQ